MYLWTKLPANTSCVFLVAWHCHVVSDALGIAHLITSRPSWENLSKIDPFCFIRLPGAAWRARSYWWANKPDLWLKFLFARPHEPVHIFFHYIGPAGSTGERGSQGMFYISIQRNFEGALRYIHVVMAVWLGTQLKFNRKFDNLTNLTDLTTKNWWSQQAVLLESCIYCKISPEIFKVWKWAIYIRGFLGNVLAHENMSTTGNISFEF